MRPTGPMLGLTLGLLLAGCGGESSPPRGDDIGTLSDVSPPSDAGDVGGNVGADIGGYCSGVGLAYHCHTGLTPDTYVPGIVKRTNNQNFDIALTSTPIPSIATLKLQLQVTRVATGELADGMQLRVIPDLHDADESLIHPGIKALGKGLYEATDVVIDQQGLWELAVLVFDPTNGNTLDVVSFFFLVLQ